MKHIFKQQQSTTTNLEFLAAAEESQNRAEPQSAAIRELMSLSGACYCDARDAEQETGLLISKKEILNCKTEKRRNTNIYIVDAHRCFFLTR